MSVEKFFSKASFFLLWAFLVGALLLPTPESFAQSRLAIGQAVYDQLQKVQERIEAEDYAGATRMLTNILQTQRRLNNYERAQIWSMQGNVFFQMEEFERALDAFETAISFDDLPAGFKLISVRTLAQLSFMQERYPQALDYTQRLMALADAPDANSHVLLAQIHYRMENLPAALQEMKRAFELERERGNTLPENWLLTINAIYYGLEDYDSMVGVLQELIELYPRDSYVLNLAAIYGQQEKTERQLLLMEPMFDQGRLKQESQLVNLANLMLLHRVPYKGAQVLEYGFERGFVARNLRNWELLAQSWQLSAEDDRAIAALTEAARLDREGNTSFRLAQMYMNLHRWAEAEKALQEALEKGQLNRPGDAQLLLGMVRFYQQDFRSARRAFLAAKEYEPTARMSEQWLVYLDQEMVKQESLQTP